MAENKIGAHPNFRGLNMGTGVRWVRRLRRHLRYRPIHPHEQLCRRRAKCWFWHNFRDDPGDSREQGNRSIGSVSKTSPQAFVSAKLRAQMLLNLFVGSQMPRIRGSRAVPCTCRPCRPSKIRCRGSR